MRLREITVRVSCMSAQKDCKIQKESHSNSDLTPTGSIYLPGSFPHTAREGEAQRILSIHTEEKFWKASTTVMPS